MKRQAWGCLIELLMFGTEAEWQAACQAVEDAAGLAMIEKALGSPYLPPGLKLGAELADRQPTAPVRQWVFYDRVQEGRWRILE